MRGTVPKVERDVSGAAARGARYATLMSAFIGVLLISNIVAVKPIAFGAIPIGELAAGLGFELGDNPDAHHKLQLPLVFDGGVFLFPLAYVLGDVLTEVYGLRAARRAIYTGFSLLMLAVLTIVVVQLAPPAEGWPHQQAFADVLGFVPRIVAASLAAFLVGQLLNAWVLARLRDRAAWRHAGGRLSLRLIVSTLVGEAADTLIFCTIAFAGVITGRSFVMYLVLGYLTKVLAEVVLLPITTRVIRAVHTAEAATVSE